jgi:hypothetical protein
MHVDHTLSIDDVALQLDWLPAVEGGRATFIARIARAGQTSTVNFEVELAKLSPTQLERLQNFLSRRHLGRTSAPEVVRTVAWLLGISLAQTRPELSVTQRRVTVRTLLLVDACQNHVNKENM